MHKLLRKGNEFKWGEEEQESFTILKDALCKEPILVGPDFDQPFTIITDASDYAIGAILTQNDKAIAYASRTLKKNELKFSPYEKELLAVIFGTEQYRAYIYGRKFTVMTDCQALKWLHDTKKPDLRNHRLKSKLEGFEFDIVYNPGKKNVCADALSRNPILEEGEIDPELPRLQLYELADEQLKEESTNPKTKNDQSEIFKLKASEPVIQNGLQAENDNIQKSESHNCKILPVLRAKKKINYKEYSNSESSSDDSENNWHPILKSTKRQKTTNDKEEKIHNQKSRTTDHKSKQQTKTVMKANPKRSPIRNIPIDKEIKDYSPIQNNSFSSNFGNFSSLSQDVENSGNMKEQENPLTNVQPLHSTILDDHDFDATFYETKTNETPKKQMSPNKTGDTKVKKKVRFSDIATNVKDSNSNHDNPNLQDILETQKTKLTEILTSLGTLYNCQLDITNIAKISQQAEQESAKPAHIIWEIKKKTKELLDNVSKMNEIQNFQRAEKI